MLSKSSSNIIRAAQRTQAMRIAQNYLQNLEASIGDGDSRSTPRSPLPITCKWSELQTVAAATRNLVLSEVDDHDDASTMSPTTSKQQEQQQEQQQQQQQHTRVAAANWFRPFNQMPTISSSHSNNNNNMLWITSVLLQSLAQRSSMFRVVATDDGEHGDNSPGDTTDGNDRAAATASDLYSSGVLRRFDDRPAFRQWLQQGLMGQVNIISRCQEEGASVAIQKDIVRRMTLPPYLHAEFYTLLESIMEVLREHGIRHWASGGTLLGAIRHRGQFIPWDDDVDLCVAPNCGESEMHFDVRLRKALNLDCASLFRGSAADQEEAKPSTRGAAARRWFAEPAPLFGYKVHATVGAESTTNLHRFDDNDRSTTCEMMKLAPFGVFVDLFVMRHREVPQEQEEELRGDEHCRRCRAVITELAYDGARRTWPHEVWLDSSCCTASSTTPRSSTATNAMATTTNDDGEPLLLPDLRHGIDPLSEHASPPYAQGRDMMMTMKRTEHHRPLPASLPIPRDAERYLNATYGNDWSTRCVIPRSAHGKTLPSQVEFSLSDYSKWMANDDL